MGWVLAGVCVRDGMGRVVMEGHEGHEGGGDLPDGAYGRWMGME